MDVDHAPVKGIEELPPDDAHEAGEDDKINIFLPEYFNHPPFAFRSDSRTRVACRGHMLRTHAVRAGNPEDARVGDVRNDDADFGRHALFADCVENGGQVRALARSEDTEAERTARTHRPDILPTNAEVDLPGTRGRIRISAPHSSRTPRSPASSDSGV